MRIGGIQIFVIFIWKMIHEGFCVMSRKNRATVPNGVRHVRQWMQFELVLNSLSVEKFSIAFPEKGCSGHHKQGKT
jgi:hypothetical protein